MLYLPAIALLAAACSDQPPTRPDDSLLPHPARVEILSGQDQVALVGTPVPTELVLKVLDDHDQPLAGQPVAYQIVSGQGMVSTDTVITDQEGVARGSWVLGPEPGVNALEARVLNRMTFREIISAIFRARGVKEAPKDLAAGIQAISGQDQVAPVGSTLPEAIVVRVVDANGKPVSGQTVDYRVTAGKGTLQIDGKVTDEAGLARAHWTLGTEPGKNTVEARVLESQTNKVIATTTFTAEGTAAPAEPAPEEPAPEQPEPEDPAPPLAQARECAQAQAGWIWCDDFEEDRLGKYFEYSNAGGSFVRASAVGVDGSHGMRARFSKGQVDAGSFKVAFGATPQSYFRPVDQGKTKYREVYWRMYVKNAPNWIGGGGDKLSRATSFVSSSSWAQSMIAHVWSGGSGHNYLTMDPASGTDTQGNLRSTTYNDFANLRWLGAQSGRTPLFDRAHVNQWYCVEAHVRLNDAGQANGIFEFWINDQLEARKEGLNWVGAYDAYGINAVLFDNYWNDGAPQTQERYFDNIVVSTQRVGCGTPQGGGSTPPPTEEEPVVTQLTVSPQSSKLTSLGETLQLQATAQDGSGQRVTDAAVTWASSNQGVVTVSSRGVITARAIGKALIIATAACCSGVTDSVEVTVDQVVASVDIAAPTTSLEPNGNIQFTAAAKDARGNAVTTASFDWSSSNTAVATVSSLGQVTGRAEGSAQITAAAGGRSAQVGVTVSTPSTPPPPTGKAPWLEIDFAKYGSTTALMADTEKQGGPFRSYEDQETSRISLDNTTGYGSSTKSMRFTFPNRASSSNRCGDYTIGRMVALPAQVNEVWVEVVAKFSTNFATKAPATWGCTSNPDYKFIFAGVNPGSRFELKSGIYGNAMSAGYPGSEEDYQWGRSADYWDGQWHRYRFHWKISSPGGSDGAVQVWIDDQLVYSRTGIRTTDSSRQAITSIYSIYLGRNMNQGPGQEQSVWWGAVRAWNTNPGW